LAPTATATSRTTTAPATATPPGPDVPPLVGVRGSTSATPGAVVDVGVAGPVGVSVGAGVSVGVGAGVGVGVGVGDGVGVAVGAAVGVAVGGATTVKAEDALAPLLARVWTEAVGKCAPGEALLGTVPTSAVWHEAEFSTVSAVINVFAPSSHTRVTMSMVEQVWPGHSYAYVTLVPGRPAATPVSVRTGDGAGGAVGVGAGANAAAEPPRASAPITATTAIAPARTALIDARATHSTARSVAGRGRPFQNPPFPYTRAS
jgi:hypothetical protein